MEFVDLRAQYELYRTEIDTRIRRVLEHCRFIMGPEIEELEQQLAQFVGVPYCITVSSGTAALELCLRALDIGPGDEVITVPFTWISTAEVIGLVGARPVFVDIDPRTYNMDPTKLEAAITKKTRAIIPVSLFGQVAEIEKIQAVADRYGITVIEDGAQSFGATRHGRRSCGLTRLGCTSFFPAKPFGCYGDGGAVFTSDAELAEKIRALRTHGGLKRHEHYYIGTNARFDTLQAAVLLAKFPHFPWEIEQRRRVAARYNELLSGFCEPPYVDPANTHVYAQYTVRVPSRDAVRERLSRLGIPTAVYYPKCLHEQPAFKELGYGPGSFPVAEKAAREVLSLPMHPFLTHHEQERVANALREAIKEVSKQ